MTELTLTREQVLAHRRRVGSLDARMPYTPESLRTAGWIGLQDSMPRAALLSIHARVAGATPSSWEHPAYVQLWGPRFQAYVVPAVDHALFSVSRYPDDARGKAVAEKMASLLHEHLAGRRMRYGDAGGDVGVHGNAFRYGAATGTILIRWEGARQPVVWTVPRPETTPDEARLEIARRYVHTLGPTTADAFAKWLGISRAQARRAFGALDPELIRATTDTGDGVILATDEPSFTSPAGPAAPAPVPAERRSVLAPRGPRPGTRRPGREAPRRAVDVAGLARGTPRRRRHRRHVAPRRRAGRRRPVAPPHRQRAPGGRGRGGDDAAAEPVAPDHDPLERARLAPARLRDQLERRVEAHRPSFAHEPHAKCRFAAQLHGGRPSVEQVADPRRAVGLRELRAIVAPHQWVVREGWRRVAPEETAEPDLDRGRSDEILASHHQIDAMPPVVDDDAERIRPVAVPITDRAGRRRPRPRPSARPAARRPRPRRRRRAPRGGQAVPRLEPPVAAAARAAGARPRPATRRTPCGKRRPGAVTGVDVRDGASPSTAAS